MKKPLIILTGPTAVGKTELSIQLAKLVNGEIISADSMQIYKEMDIGSAKIKPEEMQGIEHYLVDKIDPTEEFNVVRFQKMAKEAMQLIDQKGKIPIIVGGTGFYIQALLYDIDFTDTTEDSKYRNEMEQLAERYGNEYLHAMLQKVDEQAAKEIHANNRKRVIRALEYYKETGKPISKHNEEQREKTSPYQFAYFVLNRERSVLYERIDKRIDKMLEDGLLEEVDRLAKRGCTSDMVSMKGLGYKELLNYRDGVYSLKEAVRVIKRDTRHFAKRQITWFKREQEVNWIELDGKTTADALEEIWKICREKRIV